MKKITYWFVWYFMEGPEFRVGCGSCALDHKITMDDIMSIQRWVQNQKHFTEMPVIINFKELTEDRSEWIPPFIWPKYEAPVLGSFIDKDGISYVSIGWFNRSTQEWSDNLTGGMEATTRCTGWMELPAPREEA